MGFSASTFAGSATYFSITDGKCRIRVKDAVEGVVTRVTKNGNTVHEFVHDEFTGILTGIEAKDSEYGKQWVVTFNDGGERYVLTLKYGSNYAKTLIQALCNEAVNPSAPITLRPYAFEPADRPGKTITGVTVTQGGRKVERPYCSPLKPEPGKVTLPELEAIKVKGEVVYDDTKQMEFLESELRERFLSRLAPAPAVASVPVDTTDEAADDGLPF